MQPVKYDTFYLYDEMAAFLREAARQTDLVRLHTLTETPEGREVFLAEVTDFGTGASEDKPAYWLQAAVHAQESAGTTAALHALRELITRPDCRALLERVAFYIVPRVNPDGMEYALTRRALIRSRLTPENRKNGLIPQDMDGDGRILQMRWLDPAGSFKEDPLDPRLMVPREPGDTGPFYRVESEGAIPGYDGTAIVPGVRGHDFNRNMPANWQPSEVSGDFPLCHPETRAVAAFQIAHPNIFAGVDFHCGTNAILRPSSRPDSEVNEADMELILRVGAVAEKLTGFPLMNARDYKEAWRAPSVLRGNSNDWCYFKLGISHYVIELGNGFNTAGVAAREYLDAPAHEKATTLMRRVLKSHDDAGRTIFAPWKAFDHPQLGPVEIGGLLNGQAYYMIPDAMKNVIPNTTAFVLRHAALHPELLVANARAERVADDVVRVRATVANTGGLDTRGMVAGGSPDVRKPVRVELDMPEGAECLSRSPRYDLPGLTACGGCEYLEWFVKAPADATLAVTARHPRAGVARCELTA